MYRTDGRMGRKQVDLARRTGAEVDGLRRALTDAQVHPTPPRPAQARPVRLTPPCRPSSGYAAAAVKFGSNPELPSRSLCDAYYHQALVQTRDAELKGGMRCRAAHAPTRAAPLRVGLGRFCSPDELSCA